MDAADDQLVAMLGRLKLTAIRDQLDSLLDEAGRRELTLREALGPAVRGARSPAGTSGASRWRSGSPSSRSCATLDGFDFAAQPSLDQSRSASSRPAAGSRTATRCCPGAARGRQDASGGRARPRSDPARLHGAVRAGDDAGRSAGQGAAEGRLEERLTLLRQAEAADHRRARLPAVRARCRASVLPAGRRAATSAAAMLITSQPQPSASGARSSATPWWRPRSWIACSTTAT